MYLFIKCLGTLKALIVFLSFILKIIYFKDQSIKKLAIIEKQHLIINESKTLAWNKKRLLIYGRFCSKGK